MKTKLAVAVSIAAFASALVAAKAWAQRAAKPEPENTGLTLIGSTHDTLVYYIAYQGHTCFIASTRGGSGVSLQCPR